jgi:hypothetical protein
MIFKCYDASMLDETFDVVDAHVVDLRSLYACFTCPVFNVDFRWGCLSWA